MRRGDKSERTAVDINVSFFCQIESSQINNISIADTLQPQTASSLQNSVAHSVKRN